jgi:hypothetical protein
MGLPSDFPGDDRGPTRQHGALGVGGGPPGGLVVDLEVRGAPRLPEVGRPGAVDPFLLLVSAILLPGDRQGPLPVEGDLGKLCLRLSRGAGVEADPLGAPGLPEVCGQGQIDVPPPCRASGQAT